MLFSTCNGDESIGPGVSGCRDEFDFTITFELVFFSILPSAVFIILSLWRSLVLSSRPIIVNAPILQLVKLVNRLQLCHVELSTNIISA